jgi:hypothetical protein
MKKVKKLEKKSIVQRNKKRKNQKIKKTIEKEKIERKDQRLT